MSPNPKGTVEAVNIWKRFRADRRRLLLRDELQRVTAHLKGREGARFWRWALSDVAFVVEPGESVGLIGANGSGKSTLLKILSRVMYPHSGRVNVSGRVTAMIEVRAGLHPDLSGRENIRMYGSLMGLARREVANRFDEIVAFAELEDAIDRQLKFYSSGMQMRLGFAVAAFLDPDILLVDEVLAVGDAAFQQKCLERLRAVLAQGSTLVFVSHDLASVEATCARGVWLANGVVRSDGPIRDTLASYRQSIEERAQFDFDQSGPVRVTRVDHGDASPRTQGPLEITLVLDSDMPMSGSLFLGVSEGPAAPILLLRRDLYLDPGETEIWCSLTQLPLPRGRFYTWLGFMDPQSRETLPWRPVGCFDVVGPDLDTPPWAIVRLAPVHVDAQWRLEERRPSFVPTDNAWGPRL